MKYLLLLTFLLLGSVANAQKESSSGERGERETHGESRDREHSFENTENGALAPHESNGEQRDRAYSSPSRDEGVPNTDGTGVPVPPPVWHPGTRHEQDEILHEHPSREK